MRRRKNKVSRLDKTKMRANKAIDIIYATADAHIRKWKRRFVLASFTTIVSVGTLALVRWLER